MTDKARELLRRALECLETTHYFDKIPLGGKAIEDEIRTHLTAEEGKQDPFADSIPKGVEPFTAEEDNTIEVPKDIWVHLKKGRVTPSDLIEAVKKAEQRKPLSEETIRWTYEKNLRIVMLTEHGWFNDGVRFAEKHHGIGGGDE